jgi:hypothetical protein
MPVDACSGGWVTIDYTTADSAYTSNCNSVYLEGEGFHQSHMVEMLLRFGLGGHGGDGKRERTAGGSDRRLWYFGVAV